MYRLCTADVDGEVETITYTQCLSEAGTMEADITISKQRDGQYMVIATDTAHRHRHRASPRRDSAEAWPGSSCRQACDCHR